MTVGQAVAWATRSLELAGLKRARLDAELLVSALFGQSRAFVFTHREVPLLPTQTLLIRAWVSKRALEFPLQYLLGSQEFFGRSFFVNPEVLIPRPETELIIEAALNLLKNVRRSVQILDLGTGSGCIAVTLAAELSRSSLVAVDSSPGAVRTARLNALRHGCAERIRLLLGDLFAPVSRLRTTFDLIVSNPPYVRLDDPAVAPDVRRFEPCSSLFAGPSGLEILDAIIIQAPGFLRPGGRLIVEMGFGQADQLEERAVSSGWKLAELRNDSAGIARCAVFRRD